MSELMEKTVLVAGLGNIGSTLPTLLLQAGVGRLRLVDRDVVEPQNLGAQDYLPEDVGRLKAEVVAEQMRARFPGRTIDAWPVDLEELPGLVVAADLVLGALDSRRARQVLISELSRPMGVPVIDGGVGDGGQGRVQVFAAGEEAACLECTWGVQDYRLASREYPCAPGVGPAAQPTGAPAYLGALTASVMISEAVRLLAEPVEESYEIAFSLNQHVMRRFALRRARACLNDHAVTGEARPRTRSKPWSISTV